MVKSSLALWMLLLVAAWWLSACTAFGAEAPAPQSTATSLPLLATATVRLETATLPLATATVRLETATLPVATATLANSVRTATATPPPAATPTRAATTSAALPPPLCTPGATTPAQTEGPYYTANPPERSSLLEPGMTGTRLTLSGYVLGPDCQPIPGARVDFWQADDQGQYDNSGYRLRGYQLTNAQGWYSLETIVPGIYTGRTGHIHVKVQAPGGPILTTQLYVAGDPRNDTDSIFNARLAVTLEDVADGKTGRFDFVVPR